MDKLTSRKYNRLKSHDYSQEGFYFITICTKERQQLFWRVGATLGRQQQITHLSKYGLIIEKELEKINGVYDGKIIIDHYVIMPNHLHLIIEVACISGPAELAPTISRVIQQFKGSITKQIGFPLWQKSFHDHIIRNEREYIELLKYMEENPLKWEEDTYYKENNT